MSYGLTPQQKRLLDFIDARLRASGVSPSYDEMAAFLGLASKSSVHRMVGELTERGHVRRLPNAYRALEVIKPSANPLDAARDALARVGAPATETNLDTVAGALTSCLQRSAA